MQPKHTTPNTPVKLCECGCGEPSPLATQTKKSRGWVKGQPIRFINGHNAIRPLLERFWEKVDRRGSDECWLWQASTINSGYGQLHIGSKKDGTYRMTLAHRVSWEIHYGPIPDGMFVCHTCDRKRCTNPAHLFLGTNEENTQDKIDKGRQAKGVRHGHAKLTPEKVRHIRTLSKMGMSRKGIAARFGIHPGTISPIVTGHKWKHVV